MIRNELAAEGKPVSFTYTSYPTAETKTTGEALQAQLSAYRLATHRLHVDHEVAESSSTQ